MSDPELSAASAAVIAAASVGPLTGDRSESLQSSEYNEPLTGDVFKHVDSVEMVSTERLVSLLVPVLFGFIVIIGLIGNALVVLVVARNASMRSTTNLLILNLALADLMFIVFCVPFTACDYALAYWPFGDLWCRMVQYLILVCACASVYTLVLMSLDRFLAVVHPVRSMRLRNTRNASFALFAMWAAILSMCAPALFTHGVHEYGAAGRIYFSCRYIGNEIINHSTFQLAFFLISYVAPLCVALLLYMCMLRRLWTGGRPACSSRRRRKKVTRMVVVVMLIFAVSWAPIQVILVCRTLNLCTMRSSSAVMIQIGAQTLAYMNSCLNPILYAFLSETFRKAFRKAILCHLIGGGSGAGGLANLHQTQPAASVVVPSTAPIEMRTVALDQQSSRRCSSAQV